MLRRRSIISTGTDDGASTTSQLEAYLLAMAARAVIQTPSAS